MTKARITWPKTLRTEGDPVPKITYLAFLNDLKDSKQTDRSVPIVGGAYVDLVLRERTLAEGVKTY